MNVSINEYDNPVRAIVPYVERTFVPIISVVHTSENLAHARRVVMPNMKVKSLFIREFDSGVGLKDILQSCYAP